MPLDDAACRPDSGVGGTEDGCEGGVQFAGGLLAGELIEHGPTNDIFTKPKDERTERYVTGKFG